MHNHITILGLTFYQMSYILSFAEFKMVYFAYVELLLLDGKITWGSAFQSVGPFVYNNYNNNN